MELLTHCCIHTWWLGQGSQVRGRSIFTHLYLQISGFVSPMVVSLRPCWGMLMWLKPALIFCIYCWKEHVLHFYSTGCCSQAFVQILLFRSRTGDVLAPSVLIYVQSPYWWFCCSQMCWALVDVPAAFRACRRESGGGAEVEKRGEEGGQQSWKGKEGATLIQLPGELKHRDLPHTHTPRPTSQSQLEHPWPILLHTTAHPWLIEADVRRCRRWKRTFR